MKFKLKWNWAETRPSDRQMCDAHVWTVLSVVAAEGIEQVGGFFYSKMRSPFAKAVRVCLDPFLLGLCSLDVSLVHPTTQDPVLWNKDRHQAPEGPVPDSPLPGPHHPLCLRPLDPS